MTLYIISYEDEKELRIPKQISPDTYIGIFVAGEISDDYLFSLKNTKIPMVLVDFASAQLNSDCVLSGSFNMGYYATMHLIEKRHREIGFVGTWHLALCVQCAR